RMTTTRRRTRTLTCFLLLVGLATPLCVSRTASAQQWLKDRRYQEGIGVRTGDFELHPGLAGEIGYDSNYLLRSPSTDPNVANRDPKDGGMLRITPSLTLSTIGAQRREGDTTAAEPPKVQMRAGLAATYRELFGPK